MKPHFMFLFVVAIALPSPCWSDIQLIAPGVTDVPAANKVPFESHNNDNSKQALSFYRYVITGIDAQISVENGNNSVLHLQVMVQLEGQPNTKQTFDLDLRKTDGNTLEGHLDITPPIELVSNNPSAKLIISFVGSGNAKKPDGYFKLLGSYEKEPKFDGFGFLTLPTWVPFAEGETSKSVAGTMTIKR